MMMILSGITLKSGWLIDKIHPFVVTFDAVDFQQRFFADELPIAVSSELHKARDTVDFDKKSDGDGKRD